MWTTTVNIPSVAHPISITVKGVSIRDFNLDTLAELQAKVAKIWKSRHDFGTMSVKGKSVTIKVLRGSKEDN